MSKSKVVVNFVSKSIAKGFPEAKIANFLDKEYQIVKSFDKTETLVGVPPTSDHQVYCMHCRKMVYAISAGIYRKQIKKNSYRLYLKGVCMNCRKKVSGFLSNNLKQT